MNQELFPPLPVLLVDDEIEILKSFEIVLRSGGIKNILRCQESRGVMPILSRQEIGLSIPAYPDTAYQHPSIPTSRPPQGSRVSSHWQ